MTTYRIFAFNNATKKKYVYCTFGGGEWFSSQVPNLAEKHFDRQGAELKINQLMQQDEIAIMEKGYMDRKRFCFDYVILGGFCKKKYRKLMDDARNE